MTAREGRNFREIGGPAFGVKLYDPNGGSTNAIETCWSGPNGVGGNSSMIPHRRQEVRPIFFADDLYNVFLRWCRELQHDLIARTTKSNLRRATPAQLVSAPSR